LGWLDITFEEQPMHPKGCFTMMSLGELDDQQDEYCLIFGGWVPNRNLNDL
jgi:hypothetical protein